MGSLTKRGVALTRRVRSMPSSTGICTSVTSELVGAPLELLPAVLAVHGLVHLVAERAEQRRLGLAGDGRCRPPAGCAAGADRGRATGPGEASRRAALTRSGVESSSATRPSSSAAAPVTKRIPLRKAPGAFTATSRSPKRPSTTTAAPSSPWQHVGHRGARVARAAVEREQRAERHHRQQPVAVADGADAGHLGDVLGIEPAHAVHVDRRQAVDVVVDADQQHLHQRQRLRQAQREAGPPARLRLHRHRAAQRRHLAPHHVEPDAAAAGLRRPARGSRSRPGRSGRGRRATERPAACSSPRAPRASAAARIVLRGRCRARRPRPSAPGGRRRCGR